jgi:hypothetical protein
MKKIQLIILCLFLISTMNSQTWPISRTSSVNADVITSPFGPRYPTGGPYQLHWGIDIYALEGTYVYAVKAGTIEQMGDIGDGIIAVRINHSDGTATEYLHLKTDPCVDPDPLLAAIEHNAVVVEGQLIAFSGRSGTNSDHLHLSYFPDNSKYSYRLDTYNPMDILVHNVADDYYIDNYYWIKGGGNGGLDDQICFDVFVDPQRLDLNKIEIALDDVTEVGGTYLSERDILSSTEYETNEIAIIDFEGRSNVDYNSRIRHADGKKWSLQEFNGVEIDVANFVNSDQANYHQYRFKFNCKSNELNRIRGEIGEFEAEVSDHDSYSVSTTPTNIPIFWDEYWPYNTYSSGWPASITIGNYGKVLIQNSNSSEAYHVAATTDMIVESGGILELEDGINTFSRTWFTLQSPSSGSFKMISQNGGISDLTNGLGSSSDTLQNSTSSSGYNLWVKSGGTLKLGDYSRLENHGIMQLDGTTIISPTDAQINNYILISGTVSSGVMALSGVTITASGSTNKSTTSRPDGTYDLAVSPPFTGTVTPSRSGLSFDPPNKQYTSSISTDQSNVNFIGTPEAGSTLTISGRIQMSNGSDPSGVTIIASGTPSSNSTTSGSGGYYSLDVIGPWTGTVTPSKLGFSFDPPNIQYGISISANQSNVDFTGSPQTGFMVTISGIVSNSSGVMSGVQMIANGTSLNTSTTTNTNGIYTLEVPISWTGTVTPSYSGYSFIPKSYTSISGNLINENYTGTPIPSSGPFISVNSISPKVIPVGQTTIATTVSYTNLFKYPSCTCNAILVTVGGLIEVQTTGGNHTCVRTLAVGSYTAVFDQNEAPNGTDCGGIEHTYNLSYPFTITYAPVTLTLNSATFNGTGCGGKYLVNGSDKGVSWSGPMPRAVEFEIQSIPSTGRFVFWKWSDEDITSKRKLTLDNHFSVNAIYKLSQVTVSSPAQDETVANPTFTWQPLLGAASYHVQIATDAAFTSIIHDINTPAISYEAILNDGQTYFWRVQATFADGVNEWSEIRSCAYKEHFVSSIPTATSGNNGRKIIDNNDGNLHVVYSSGGSIWFTSYGCNGAEWTSEIKIGDGKNPCISPTYIPNEINIVWEQELGSGSRKVIYRRSIDDGYNWQSPIESPIFTGEEATPVVFGNALPVVAWRGPDGIYVCLDPPYHGSANGLVNSKLAGTTSQSKLPSGAEDFLYLYDPPPGFYPQINLVYTDDDAIYYIFFKIDLTVGVPEVVGCHAPVQISAIGSTGNTNPCITSTYYYEANNFIAATWQNTSTGKIYYRQAVSTPVREWEWPSEQVEISHGSHLLSQPSIGFSINDQMGIMFQCGDHIGYCTRSAYGGSWTQVVDLGAGKGPSLSLDEFGTSNSSIWTKGSTAPYAIYPSLVPTIVSGAITGNTTWGDELIAVAGNVTVNAGVTLTILPYPKILFASGTSLIVDGNLTANGNVVDQIILDRSGSSGTWVGVQFNAGSSGSVQYCTITHAAAGISCNGTSLPQISHNTITGCSSQGIYLYNASPRISYNDITNNGNFGINCNYYSSPILYNNTITGHSSYGLRCNNSSSAWLSNKPSSGCCPGRGYNVIRQNAKGISASSASNVYLGDREYGGYNCVHDNTGKEFEASNNSAFTMKLENTWWNHTTSPYYKASDFYQYSSTLDYIPAFPGPDPNGCPTPPMPKIASNESTETVFTDNQSSLTDEELKQAYDLEINGEYVDAIDRYTQKLKKVSQKEIKEYSLVRLAECYRSAGITDWTGFMKNQRFSEGDELFVKALELEYTFLVQNGKYNEAKDNLNAIIGNYSKNETVHKHALFNLGHLYYYKLNDKAKGNEYFNELKAKYADDELTYQCRLLLGEIDKLPDLQQLDAENGKGTQETALPDKIALMDNYPNPFNPVTTIKYQLPVISSVKLCIFDVLGREVITLVDGIKEAGYYTTIFDGSRLSSGIYFTRFVVQPQSGDANRAGEPFVQVKKMLMIK